MHTGYTKAYSKYRVNFWSVFNYNYIVFLHEAYLKLTYMLIWDLICWFEDLIWILAKGMKFKVWEYLHASSFSSSFL